MKQTNQSLKILAVIVGGVLGYAVVSKMYEAGRQKSRLAQYNSHVSQEVENMNKTLPRMFDAETRLDKVAAGPRQITYFFTLPNKERKDLDLSALQSALQENITANYETNSKLAADRVNGTVMKYQYKDKNNEVLFEVSAGPKTFK